MCVACRESQDKKTLVRIVRTPEGVFVDESGKLSGRGAYLHAEPLCWEQGLKKSLEKSLMVEISSADRDRLIQYQDSFSNQNDQADDEVD
jgi:predicted RNA-binding protein YlxR (DUF448 family)